MEKKYLIVTRSLDKANDIAKIINTARTGVEFSVTFRKEKVKMIVTSVKGHIHTYCLREDYVRAESCRPWKFFENFEDKISKIIPDGVENIATDLKKKLSDCKGIIVWTDNDGEGDIVDSCILNLIDKPELQKYRVKCSVITKKAFSAALKNAVCIEEDAVSDVDVRNIINLLRDTAFTRLLNNKQQVFTKIVPYIKYESDMFLLLAYVVEQTKKETTKMRPMPLNTAEMLKNISKFLGINVENVMRIAKSLNYQGYISHPYTSTTLFPSDYSLRDLVWVQIGDKKSWNEHALNIIGDGGPNPRRDGKTDNVHPPIHPIKYAEGLSGDDQIVYKYIVEHFLACVYKDAEIGPVNESGSMRKNYLDIYRYELESAGEPASRKLSEGDIIDYMKRHGIGTSSTYVHHINNLLDNGYAIRDGIYVRATGLGIGLIEGFDKMDLQPSLTKLELHNKFEQDLKHIRDGLKTAGEVLENYTQIYKGICETVATKMSCLYETLDKQLGCEPKDPMMKCEYCQNEIVIKRWWPKNENPSKLHTTCIMFPHCTNTIWFTYNVEDVRVLPESCQTCEADVKMLEIKCKNMSNTLRKCIICCKKDNEYKFIVSHITWRPPTTTNKRNKGKMTNKKKSSPVQNESSSDSNTSSPSTSNTTSNPGAKRHKPNSY